MPSPIEREVAGELDPILAVLRANFQARIAGRLARVYLAGSAEMITWGKTKAGIPIAYEGPPIRQAISWAEREAAQLVKGMDEETKTRLAQVVSDGIKGKRGIPGLARDIRQGFEDMTTKRSKLIAQTETCNALEQAFLDRADAMGVEGKEWVVAGDERTCDICLGNEAAGVIPLSETFPSGDMRPPAHPGDRCALAPAMVGKR